MTATKTRPKQKGGHPCPWTRPVLNEVVCQLDIEALYLDVPRLAVIDGFAGSGKRVWNHAGARRHVWVGLELEPSFIEAPWVQQGNALRIPFGAGSFDAYATSLVFPNGMTDDFISKDDSHRNTYSHFARHNVGDPTYRLHRDNAGAMGWGRGRGGDGSAWRDLHVRAFAEGRRVLGPGGLFVLEVKDHPVGGELVPVTQWVHDELVRQGCELVSWVDVPVRGNRNGANRELRAEHSTVLAMRVK